MFVSAAVENEGQVLSAGRAFLLHTKHLQYPLSEITFFSFSHSANENSNPALSVEQQSAGFPPQSPCEPYFEDSIYVQTVYTNGAVNDTLCSGTDGCDLLLVTVVSQPSLPCRLLSL